MSRTLVFLPPPGQRACLKSQISSASSRCFVVVCFATQQAPPLFRRCELRVQAPANG